jgi:DNA polymerase elongation subunit (family B)
VINLNLNGKEKNIQKIRKQLAENKASLSESEITNLTEEIAKHKALANLYDKKQLPLKILANSWFGSYGAPYIFNWVTQIQLKKQLVEVDSIYV